MATCGYGADLSERNSDDSTDYQILRITKLGQDWGEVKSKGNSYSLTYDKSNKESFLQVIESSIL